MKMRLLFCAMYACTVAQAATPAPSWPGWGGPSPNNQRNAVGETSLSPANVGSLVVKWTARLGGNVSATPTIIDTTLYVADDAGGITAINTATGHKIWQQAMSTFTGNGGSASHSSPAIAGNLIVLADKHSGTVVALDRTTGALAWTTVVETHQYATLTASPVIAGNIVLVGASSNEEYWVSVLTDYTPSFRGSVSALNLATGQVLWKTYTVPTGYTGGAVWGSGFPVSTRLNRVFIATGNNYSVPQTVDTCLQANRGTRASLACMDPNNFVDAVVALDLGSGAPVWSHRLQGADLYTSNCTSPTPAQPCPVPEGSDYDFGSAPNLFTATQGGKASTLVGAGQKSGRYWALTAATGRVAWSSQAAPGSQRGGMLWGSAVDATHVFIAENDGAHATYTMGPDHGRSTDGGSWAALDPATGATLWQQPAGTDVNNPVGLEGALSVANGVLFGETTTGDMVAMDAGSGAVLWRYATGYSVSSGPAIVGGVVYWGSGDVAGSPHNKLFAFAVPGTAAAR